MQQTVLKCKMDEEIDSHRSPLLPSPGYLAHLEGVCAWRFGIPLLGQVNQHENGWIMNSHTPRAHRLFAALWYFTWWILSLMGPLACRKYPAMCGSHLKWFTAINRGEITSELPLAWYQPVQVQTGAFSLLLTFDFSPHFLPCLNVTTLWEDLMLLLTLIAS